MANKIKKDSVLFDYVLVVRLKNEDGVPKSFVNYRFPPQPQTNNVTGNANDKDNLANTIVQFCFPEAEQWINPKFMQDKKKMSENFSFVLTESDGSKKFGYCRRFLTEEDGKPLPECFCVLSFLPSVSLFMELLDIIEQLRKKSSSSVFSFLKSVLAQTFPNPGESLTIRTFEGQQYTLRRRDNDFLLDFVSFQDLIRAFDASDILNIFAGLLTESRIIVISKSPTQLSKAINGIVAFMYPFTWQHVFIPILPKPLMSYCCAPMPFIVGVLQSNAHELNSFPLEECLMLDVDTGKILRELPITCDSAQVLPPALAYVLSSSLQKLKKSKQSTTAFDLSVSSAFLQFLYNIFNDYQNYFEKSKFNKERFKSDKPEDIQKFLSYFGETQIYESFVREREEMANNGTLSMCVLNPTKFAEVIQKSFNNIVSDYNFTKDESKDTPSCDKCGKDLTNANSGEAIQKHNKLYCFQCFTKKKSKPSSKDKFRSMMHSISSGNLNLLVGRESNPEKTERPPEKTVEKPSTDSPVVSNNLQNSNKSASKEEEDKTKEMKVSSPKIVSKMAARPVSTPMEPVSPHTSSPITSPLSVSRPPIPNKPLPQLPRENRSASTTQSSPLQAPLKHKSRSFSLDREDQKPKLDNQEQKTDQKRRTPLAAFCSTCGTRLNSAGVCSKCD